MPNLTDHQRRQIIELLEQGQNLPPDDRYLLFARGESSWLAASRGDALDNFHMPLIMEPYE